MLTKNFIHVIVFYACIGDRNPSSFYRQYALNDIHTTNEISINNSCMTNELYTCIQKYIKEVDGYFINKESLFISIYFFTKHNSDYFTLWAFTCYPEYIQNNSKLSRLTYYFFSIEDRKVVLITNKREDENILFSSCKKNIDAAITLKNIRPENDINYDGSWFPKTYSYFKKGDQIFLEMLNDPIIDFLGPSYQRFEENLKN